MLNLCMPRVFYAGEHVSVWTSHIVGVQEPPVVSVAVVLDSRGLENLSFKMHIGKPSTVSLKTSDSFRVC